MTYKHWTVKEEEYLRDNYLTLNNSDLAINLKRTPKSVAAKLLDLKLSRQIPYESDLEGEIWVDFEESYRVSNMGRFISKRYNNIMKFNINNKGYLSLSINNHSTLAHIIIALLFCEGYEEGKEVNHKDGDKTNIKASNLEWLTHRENMEHARKLKLHDNFKYGEENPLSKYPNSLVKSICQDIADGILSDLQISAKYGTTKDYVYRIRRKERSREISKEYF